ncbi:ion transporter [Prochlorothrix hollandica]|uniref:Voltage-gated potassium channel n=1 Tax=Prochlorothrix hollandica PCC 9006 = CALU 1027 TaxID=317619 RepID=A0A0M2PTS9_PROHO|nr:ion transporter [Prochlorothrix hollandica]KKI99905.1 voltage-gated potassium channel [Prochlorothrix hollandica PCC 9006 = CALU 1027]
MSTLKKRLRHYKAQWGNTFDMVIQGLIIFSLITFSIETLPDLSESVNRFLHISEAVTVFIFTAEYLLRLYMTDRKLSFIFSFFGLIDLLSILPFYISTTVDLRSIRIFRLFRLFRILKMMRYNRAIRRFNRALLIAKEEFILFAMMLPLLLFFSAVGIYYFEHEVQPETFGSVFHSLWWAVCTITTVGYGDVYPVTLGGRMFTFVVLIIGLGIISVPAGLVSSALSKARELEEEEDLTRHETKKPK